MTWCHTHSHYPDTEPTTPHPILLMPNARLGSDKYQFYKSLVLLDQDSKMWGPDSNPWPSDSPISRTRHQCSTHSATAPGISLHLYLYLKIRNALEPSKLTVTPIVSALSRSHDQNYLYICLLLFYVLATSNVISWRLPTCDSANSWRLYSATPLRNQAASTMIRFPT